MSDTLSFAEVHNQLVELLPARTVLSLLHAPQTGVIGAPGDPGRSGSAGPGLVDSMGLLGNNDQSSASRLVVGITQPGGTSS